MLDGKGVVAFRLHHLRESAASDIAVFPLGLGRNCSSKYSVILYLTQCLSKVGSLTLSIFRGLDCITMREHGTVRVHVRMTSK